MYIDRKTLQQIVDVLVPHVETVQKRQALVGLVYHDTQLIQAISYEGDARTFAFILVKQSLEYGELHPGEHALMALLYEVRRRVGVDSTADQLIKKLEASQENKSDSEVDTFRTSSSSSMENVRRRWRVSVTWLGASFCFAMVLAALPQDNMIVPVVGGMTIVVMFILLIVSLFTTVHLSILHFRKK